MKKMKKRMKDKMEDKVSPDQDTHSQTCTQPTAKSFLDDVDLRLDLIVAR